MDPSWRSWLEGAGRDFLAAVAPNEGPTQKPASLYAPKNGHGHLAPPPDVDILKAQARISQLVNAHRVPPAVANPVHLNDILDKLLHQQQPDVAASTYNDAQRQSLLDQLLKEDADAQAQDDAEALARRQSRLQRAAAKAGPNPADRENSTTPHHAAFEASGDDPERSRETSLPLNKP